MGHIYTRNERLQDALKAWTAAYMIAKPMNLAEVLQALAQQARSSVGELIKGRR
ncbi:MAG: hypothetical protein M1398_03945 [Deltaproteobacteria bacterium]|jgi:hypothetical protein|nr:hypothetical protein [Deltaproteobacteria bacterium]